MVVQRRDFICQNCFAFFGTGQDAVKTTEFVTHTVTVFVEKGLRSTKKKWPF